MQVSRIRRFGSVAQVAAHEPKQVAAQVKAATAQVQRHKWEMFMSRLRFQIRCFFFGGNRQKSVETWNGQ
jgi:hypothetical protein